MTLEAVQPATATQTATSIELKSDRVTVTFDPATGMISRIISGGTEVPFKDGPVAVGMKMRYEPTLSYVRNSNEGLFTVPNTKVPPTPSYGVLRTKDYSIWMPFC